MQITAFPDNDPAPLSIERRCPRDPAVMVDASVRSRGELADTEVLLASEPPPPFLLSSTVTPNTVYILFVFFLFSDREIVSFTREKESKQLIVKERGKDRSWINWEC
jgi:hypothetical protein